MYLYGYLPDCNQLHLYLQLLWNWNQELHHLLQMQQILDLMQSHFQQQHSLYSQGQKHLQQLLVQQHLLQQKQCLWSQIAYQLQQNRSLQMQFYNHHHYQQLQQIQNLLLQYGHQLQEKHYLMQYFHDQVLKYLLQSLYYHGRQQFESYLQLYHHLQQNQQYSPYQQ